MIGVSPVLAIVVPLTDKEYWGWGFHSHIRTCVRVLLQKWEADFKATGATRGVGWAVLYMDPTTGALNNHFVELHENGNGVWEEKVSCK